MPIVPENYEQENFSRKVVSGLGSGKIEMSDEVKARVSQREDEIRDLYVLEACAQFEEKLRTLLNDSDQGVLVQEDRNAHGCTAKVADFFDTEGEKIKNDLPDEACLLRFSALLANRRTVALITSAEHESREFFKWKNKVVAETVEQAILSAAADPDPKFLEYSSELIEGTVRRLFRGEDEKTLAQRIHAALSRMYKGALESLNSSDPHVAMEFLKQWKVNLDKDDYAELKKSIMPNIFLQKVRKRYEELRFMDSKKAAELIKVIKEKSLRDELSEMVSAGRNMDNQKDAEKIESCILNYGADLFRKLRSKELSPDEILYSDLPSESRLMWLKIINRSFGEADNSVFISTVESITSGNCLDAGKIYAACASGLSVEDAEVCFDILELRKRADWKPIANCISLLKKISRQYAADDEDVCALIRDFNSRLKKACAAEKTPDFTKLSEDLICDHFKIGMTAQKAKLSYTQDVN